VRVPVVPGVNDDDQNLMAIGELARANGVTRIDLLPYHTAGIAKYERLGRPYALPDVAAQPLEALDPAKRQLETLGLTVHLGG
jgi:pyruvate formate lyase activating enzyme